MMARKQPMGTTICSISLLLTAPIFFVGRGGGSLLLEGQAVRLGWGGGRRAWF